MENEILNEQPEEKLAGQTEAAENKTKNGSEAELEDRIKALENENKQLRESIDALKILPHFSIKSKNERDSFSAVREIFRKR